ncbi:MAG: hypothetical protein ACYTG4_10975 [Planctomycetota bacterium]|jgi:hypothetical protein
MEQRIRREAAVLALLVLLAGTALAAPGLEKRVQSVTRAGRTVFCPTMDRSVPEGRNAIWCATFQAAWDALKEKVVGEPIRLSAEAPDSVAQALNADPVAANVLDPLCFFSDAGFGRDGVQERIRKGLRDKFGSEAPQPSFDGLEPDDVLAYAYLRASLPFRHAFEDLPSGMEFDGTTTSVRAWGTTGKRRADVKKKRMGQVRVLYDGVAEVDTLEGGKERRDFILELRPKKAGERILLARIGGHGSLENEWRTVTQLTKGRTAEAARSGSILQVPVIDFDLEHRYAQLEGARLANERWKAYTISKAAQDVAFRLDHTGAKIESSAEIRMKWKAALKPAPSFIFDRPFLVALQRDGAEKPYLLVRIANTDLMPKP